MHPSSMPMRAAIAALLVVALPGSALAQQRPERPGRNLDGMMVGLTEQLELSEEQVTQIRELLTRQNEQSREMIQEARASGQGRSAFVAMRERMTELREGTDANIKTILSVEQVARYEEIITSRRANRPPRRGPGERPGGPRGS